MLSGNGKLDQVFVANRHALTLSDTTMPCLALAYSTQGIAGEVPTVRPHAATIAIDANGAAGSLLLITVSIKRKDNDGTDLAAVDYVISGAATGDVAFTALAADASTLKEAIDLLNQIPGIKAWAMHAPHDMSLATDNFIDLAATYIQNGMGPGTYTNALHRDVDQFQIDSDYVAYMRVGLPEVRDANAFKLIDIFGTATGVTNGTIRVFRDDIREYVAPTGTYATDLANKDVLVHATLDAAAEYGAGYAAAKLDVAPTVQGPVIVEVKSDDISACSLWVMIQQATLMP